jgi:hypothetical protein
MKMSTKTWQGDVVEAFGGTLNTQYSATEIPSKAEINGVFHHRMQEEAASHIKRISDALSKHWDGKSCKVCLPLIPESMKSYLSNLLESKKYTVKFEDDSQDDREAPVTYLTLS